MRSKKEIKHLTNLSDDMLKKVEQADQLKDLASRNPEEASRLNTILDTFMNPGSNIDRKEKLYKKINSLTKLISKNIDTVKRSGTSQFDWLEYHRDNNFVFSIKSRIASTGVIRDYDLNDMNEFYKKHIRLDKLFNSN